MIQNYNTFFRSITDVSDQQKSISVTLPTNAMNHTYASTKRFIPSVEKFKQHRFKKSKMNHPIEMPVKSPMKMKSSSCSFCKGVGHRISNCPLKDSYGEMYDGTTLVKYITT